MAHSEHKKEEIHVHYTSLAGEHGDQGRRTYEYGNPIHHTGLTGDYDTHGRQTDQHGNPVYHAGLTGEYGDQGRQTDHGNPVYRAGLTGDYGTQGPQRVGVGTGDKYGAPGTTGAYPTTGNIPYAGTEAGGEAWKEKHGTTGAYPTRANVPYAGADVDPGFGREHKKQEHHGRTGTGVFGRSGNSSSSSSEDDGEGGRRKKKGLKEKLPGGHKEATSTTTPGYHGYNKDDKDKKGTVEKIKEKLPGTRHH